jgi:putative FmdB family regulatory protein
MPTYEFRCANGHAFDEFHKISDAPQTATCPTCGAEATRAISGGAGLVFKGSGFYLTDYGKNAHRSSGPTGGDKKEGKAEGGAKGDGGAAKDGGSSGGANSGAGTAGGGTSSGASTGGSSTGGAAGGSSSGGTASGGASSGGAT